MISEKLNDQAIHYEILLQRCRPEILARAKKAWGKDQEILPVLREDRTDFKAIDSKDVVQKILEE